MIAIRQFDGSFAFEVTSPSGGTLLKSVPFPDIQDAEEALATLRQFRDKKVVVFDRRTNLEGKFFFQMKRPSGPILGSSQLYDSEPGMENGIKNLKRRLSNLPD